MLHDHLAEKGDMRWLHGQVFRGVRLMRECLHTGQLENSLLLLVKILWG